MYFSPHQDLNDPMEGSREIRWRGDRIVWENLLKHYVLCLYLFCSVTLVAGEDLKPDEFNFSLHTVASLGQLPARDVFLRADHVFRSDRRVRDLTEHLTLRESVSRNELIWYLSCIHVHALHSVFSTLYSRNLIPKHLIPAAMKRTGKAAMMDRAQLATFRAELEAKSSSDAEEVFATLVAKLQRDALIANLSALTTHKNRGWPIIWTAFPERYVVDTERLIYWDWYAVCFATDPNDPTMWSHYAASHTGVCLKFKCHPAPDGNSSVNLWRRSNAITQSSGYPEKTGPQTFPVKLVLYERARQSIDFFTSIGRLSERELLQEWYTDRLGNLSEYSLHIQDVTKEWRSRYWREFEEAILIKSENWSYEKEVRILYVDILYELEEKSKRTFTYGFDDLESITFGINTTLDQKLAIIKVISEKCRNFNREDFEFRQAIRDIKENAITSIKLDGFYKLA